MKMPARMLFVAAALVALHAPARADTAAQADPTCQQAGEAAEQRWNLPTGLLAAIGRIESGRYDAAERRVIAWPWTINAAGAGAWFADRTQAIDAVQAHRMRGTQSIDVGCFQVNLLYHPSAFATLEQGFDAGANADYAARFLSELHARSGSWERAVAWYHSATPGMGDPYRDRVLADWSGGGMRILPIPAAEGAALRPARGDPFVVMAAVHGSVVRIWTPNWAARPSVVTPSAGPGRAPAILVAAASGMPRIITLRR